MKCITVMIYIQGGQPGTASIDISETECRKNEKIWKLAKCFRAYSAKIFLQIGHFQFILITKPYNYYIFVFYSIFQADFMNHALYLSLRVIEIVMSKMTFASSNIYFNTLYLL